MSRYWRKVGKYLGALDVKAAASLMVSSTILLSVIAILFVGRQWVGADQDDGLPALLMTYRDAPWAIFVVISVFVILALTGFPQILLITATVLTFGPLQGAVYSWVSTMISATVTFAIGQRFGGNWVRRIGGKRMGSFIDFVSDHGIIASGLIRIVPSGPFVAVNAAAGATRLPLWKFAIGSGVGFIPKIAFVALIGATASVGDVSLTEGMGTFLAANRGVGALVGGLVLVWVGILIIARRYYRELRNRQ